MTDISDRNGNSVRRALDWIHLNQKCHKGTQEKVTVGLGRAVDLGDLKSPLSPWEWFGSASRERSNRERSGKAEN